MKEYIMRYENDVLQLLPDKIQPLVRCKDCEYWQDNNGGYPNPDCPWGKDETPDPDDFCSFGERKDGEGE